MLLGLCDVGSLEEAEDLFDGFFPGDALTGRAVDMVKAPFPGPPPSRPCPPSARTGRVRSLPRSPRRN